MGVLVGFGGEECVGVIVEFPPFANWCHSVVQIKRL